jgi:hypothetical protein
LVVNGIHPASAAQQEAIAEHLLNDNITYINCLLQEQLQAHAQQMPLGAAAVVHLIMAYRIDAVA